jgi:hypothetical protein
MAKNKIVSNRDYTNDLRAHERECAIRYENIEKRLDSGSRRFARMEGMIIGLYGLIIASQLFAGWM